MRPGISGLLIAAAFGLTNSAYPQDKHPYRVPINMLPECPHAWSEVLEAEKRQAPAVAPFFGPNAEKSIAGPLTDVPEYHDCQRLINVSFEVNPLAKAGATILMAPPVTIKRTYGPLVAVFASGELRMLEEQLGFHPGQVVLASKDDTVTAKATDQFVAAVQVVKIDRHPYFPLGLTENGYAVRCIYLFSDGAGWEARMHTPPEIECPRKLSRAALEASGPAMTVQPSAYSGYSERDYPPVARWEWNAFSQSIGVKCGAAWCRLSFVDIDYIPAGPEVATTSVSSIPGWYDDQLLDTWDTSTNWSKVTSTRGFVIPDPKLDSWNDAKVFADTFLQVATVRVTSNEYKNKANFTKTDEARVNTLFLRMRTRGPQLTYPNSDCAAAESAPAGTPRIKEPTWEAKVLAADGTCRLFSVERRPPGTTSQTFKGRPIHVIGTARWRWVAKDATIWLKCGEACCEVEH